MSTNKTLQSQNACPRCGSKGNPREVNAVMFNALARMAGSEIVEGELTDVVIVQSRCRLCE